MVKTVKILIGINQEGGNSIEYITQSELNKDSNQIWDITTGNMVTSYYLVFDQNHNLITQRELYLDKLVRLRDKWTMDDYVEAYGDVWEVKPTTLNEAKEFMKSYILNTYDDSYIIECINNEC